MTNDEQFVRDIHAMFDHIWNCEIDHPIFHDTVGDLMAAVIECHKMQPEHKAIGYRDCATAMLKMWMCDIVTDGEYFSIMDKLNAYRRKINNGKQF